MQLIGVNKGENDAYTGPQVRMRRGRSAAVENGIHRVTSGSPIDVLRRSERQERAAVERVRRRLLEQRTAQSARPSPVMQGGSSAAPRTTVPWRMSAFCASLRVQPMGTLTSSGYASPSQSSRPRIPSIGGKFEVESGDSTGLSDADSQMAVLARQNRQVAQPSGGGTDEPGSGSLPHLSSELRAQLRAAALQRRVQAASGPTPRGGAARTSGSAPRPRIVEGVLRWYIRWRNSWLLAH